MSVGTIITTGYGSFGGVPDVILLGYAPTGVTPGPAPAARYGPALTPAQRRRWFGDDDDRIRREARRKALEKLARIEIGLLEPDKEAITETIEAAVEKKVDRKVSAISVPVPDYGKQADAIIARISAQVAKEVREEFIKHRIELDEEEEEAMLILSMLD